MGKTEKLLEKFGNSKNTFPYKDLVVLLSQLGYEKFEMAGSRVRFFNEKTEHMIYCIDHTLKMKSKVGH